jgi:hypothetical protein
MSDGPGKAIQARLDLTLREYAAVGNLMSGPAMME